MNVQEIVEILGGEQSAAVVAGVHQTTVASWIRNESIPHWHWDSIIKATRGKVTVNQLHDASKKNQK